MDLLSVLPDFSTKSYAHILPPLERSKITTVDLITLDTLEIAKRAHVPPTDVRRLSAQIIEALHADLGFKKSQADIAASSDAEPSSFINPDTVTVAPRPTTKLQTSRWDTISTLDPTMDELLGGGIPMGYVTEITGERYVLGNIELEIQDTVLICGQFLSTVAAARPNCSSVSFWRPS
jgi:DNA repair protein RAD57